MKFVRKLLELALLVLVLLLCVVLALLIAAMACPKPGGPHPVPTAQAVAHDPVEEFPHGRR